MKPYMVAKRASKAAGEAMMGTRVESPAMAFLFNRALAGKPVYIKPPTVANTGDPKVLLIDRDRQGYNFTLSAGRQKCSRALHRRSLRALRV